MSATPKATALPSGISPPLAVDNDNDHGGLVIIFTSISLFLTFWALGMRIVTAPKRQGILRHELFIATLVRDADADADLEIGQRCLADPRYI